MEKLRDSKGAYLQHGHIKYYYADGNEIALKNAEKRVMELAGGNIFHVPQNATKTQQREEIADNPIIDPDKPKKRKYFKRKGINDTKK